MSAPEQEGREDRLRAGLYGVYGRWQTIYRDGWGVTALSTAMALEAIRALNEAYPTDPLYRSQRADMERDFPD